MEEDVSRIKNFGYIDRYITDISNIGEVQSDIGNRQLVNQSFEKMLVVSPIYIDR